jgi:hypothetical protein
LIRFDFSAFRLIFYGFLRIEMSVLHPTCFASAAFGFSVFTFDISFFMRRVYRGHMDIRCPCENIFYYLKITFAPENLALN